MAIGNNKRNIPRYGKKVFSGFHKPPPSNKLKPKLSGYGKYEKSTLTEIRKIIENTK
jgi:hypothetical protein